MASSAKGGRGQIGAILRQQAKHKPPQSGRNAIVNFATANQISAARCTIAALVALLLSLYAYYLHADRPCTKAKYLKGNNNSFYDEDAFKRHS